MRFKSSSRILREIPGIFQNIFEKSGSIKYIDISDNSNLPREFCNGNFLGNILGNIQNMLEMRVYVISEKIIFKNFLRRPTVVANILLTFI